MSRQKQKQNAKPPAPRSDASGVKAIRANAATTVPAAASIVDDGAPFGTRPRRSRGPLIAWCIAYGVWLGILIYFAAYTVGLK